MFVQTGGGAMLELIDGGLESFLRASVPLSAVDVDVSFEAPDREWSSKLSRPTVNCFLWDLRRSADKATAGVRTVVRDGVRVHQHALPVVELRYVVTAWTNDHSDERVLLAGLMRSLLAAGQISYQHLDESLHQLPEPVLAMARAGEDHMDVFKALEGKVKPGLNIVVSTQMDTGVYQEAGPPVESIITAIGQIGADGPEPTERRRIAGEVLNARERGLVGAIVRSPSGATRISDAGRFLLRAQVGDEIIIDAESELRETVSDVGGVRFE
ncbi:MAG: hypothetical protein ACI8V4_003150 [Ilumatobacter sp.]|jgi:hypothetical protein